MYFALIERIFWLVLSTVLVSIGSIGTIADDFYAVATVSLVLFIFCIRVFIGHGAQVVTPLGVWSLMTALVGGYAGLVGWDDPRVATSSVYLAVSLVLLQTVGIAIIAWGASRHTMIPRLRVWESSRKQVLALCWLLLFSSTVVQEISHFGRIISEGIAFSVIVVIAFVTWGNEKAKLISLPTISVLFAFIFYVVFLHSGSGRLRLAALAFSIMMVATLQLRTWLVKWISVSAIPFGLAFFAWYRLNFIENNFGSAEGRTGLESLTDPLITFSFFIDMEARDAFIFQGYKNLLTPIGFLLPDSWEIPTAFGYEIVGIWWPENFETGYSAAATAAGEWYWMGGIPAVVLSILILGSVLRFVITFRSKIVLGFMENRTQTILLLVVILLGCSLGDLVWGGIHTFIYRSVVRVFTAIFIVFLISALKTPLSNRISNQKMKNQRRIPDRAK